jgi:hypothetical protein
MTAQKERRMHSFAVAFQHLQDDLPKTDYILTSDMDRRSAEALWLRNSFLKKFEDAKNSDADDKALGLFVRSNERCKSFALNPSRLFQEELIEGVKNLFDSYFHDGPNLAFDLSNISGGFMTGPGASQGSYTDHFYTKLFDSNLTSTSERLYRDYRCAIVEWATWNSAEIARETHRSHAIVEGNRLSFVPKTTEISRTICTEPNLNMLFQKGIGSFLEEQLARRWKLHMSDQQLINRRMARLGSIDGSYGTIDLSSASDSVSLNLLRDILPPFVMRWLEHTRSPSVTLPGGKKVQLHMVSSMGNAFTFPLQTILFASIVVTSYDLLGIPLIKRSTIKGRTSKSMNFGVFGDDIIVTRESYNFIVQALELFGFEVNTAKSFNTGHFRESCGGDYFRGDDIRGVYLKHLSTSADVYSIINRLVRWSARSGIMLHRTIGYLLTLVDFLPVPPDAGDTEGIKLPCAPSGMPRDKNTGGVIYSYLSSRPMSYRLPTADDELRHYPSSRGEKRRQILFNPDGLLTSFVGGFVTGGRATVRSNRVRFKIRRRVTSSWFDSNAVGAKEPLGRLWKEAAEMLLT